MEKYKNDIFNFGKYHGKKISEVNDIKYLKWIIDGCKLPLDFNDRWYSTKQTDDLFVEKVKEHLLSIGEAVVYNNDIMSVEYYNNLIKWNNISKESEFVGEKGERILLNNVVVSSIKEISVNSKHYPTMYIITFIDNNNNMFITVRSSRSSTENRFIKKGDVINIKGTIKGHKIYKGIKETILSRVTF